jgi:hypothetical protein
MTSRLDRLEAQRCFPVPASPSMTIALGHIDAESRNRSIAARSRSRPKIPPRRLFSNMKILRSASRRISDASLWSEGLSAERWNWLV